MIITEYLQKKYTKAEIIEIMTEALEIMQQYNGRTVSYCIAEAMECEIEEKEDGSNIIKPPRRKGKQDMELRFSQSINGKEITNELTEKYKDDLLNIIGKDRAAGLTVKETRKILNSNFTDKGMPLNNSELFKVEGKNTWIMQSEQGVLFVEVKNK